MNRTSVQSSQLASAGYDPATQTMEIEFKAYKGTNPIYQYSGVAPADYAKLMMSESKGRHFRQHIKGKFPYKKL